MLLNYLKLVILVCCCIVAAAEFQSTVSVSSHCPRTVNGTDRCTSLEDGLKMIESNTNIEIQPGNYIIRESYLWSGISNIQLFGSGNGSCNIICEGDGGMAFINVINLTIASLSINRCGLNSSVLMEATEKLKEIVDVWFVIPSDIRVGLFIGYGQSITIVDTSVNGTDGIGILAVNIMGKSLVSSAVLSQNKNTICSRRRVSSKSFRQIGGGAYFMYFDFHDSNYSSIWSQNNLTVSDSIFSRNTDCSNTPWIYMNYRLFPDRELEYIIGGGGGFSIIYAHSTYSIATRVLNTTFYRNIAKYGGGGHVATFANFSTVNSVSFENCTFMKNGNDASNPGIQAYSRGGAGLAIFSDLFKPSFFWSPIASINNITILVKNTIFERNTAEIEGGGMYANSLGISPHQAYSVFLSDRYYSVHWQLRNVTFLKNVARVIAAAAFSHRTFFGIDGSVLVVLDSVKVKGSYSLLRNSSNPLNQEVYNAMSLRHVVVHLVGSSTFEQNDITALYILSTIVFCLDRSSLEFKQNRGYRGGAIYIEGYSPAFLLKSNVTLNFSENRGDVEGGAVYFSTPSSRREALEPSHLFGCFISTYFYQISEFFNLNITVVFHENKAPLGSSVFGADLKFCRWSYLVENSSNIYETLHQNHNSTFSFSKPPVEKEQVSTMPTGINVKGSTIVLPGETQEVNITVFDSFSNKIFSVVTTDLNSTNRSLLGNSGYIFTSQENSTVQIFGEENITSTVSYFTITNVVTTNQEVRLLSCPAGFDFDAQKQACVCSTLLDDLKPYAVCSNVSLTITVQRGYWLGMDLSNTLSASTEDLMFHSCYFGFCNGATFRPPEYDSQCANGSMRTGVLCGACKDGYSETFGVMACKKCSNFSLFYILVSIVYELGLFIAVAFFGFTVDRGWMYALLYYSSLLALYFFHSLPLFKLFDVFFIPTLALTLETFRSICFYDGMTALQRYAVQLFSSVYFCALVLIFRFVCRKFSFLNSRFSPAKTFATLSMICYVNILVTVTSIFPAVPMVTLGNKHSVRWLRDPNQIYFRGWHIPIVLLVYVTGLTIVLGCPLLLLCPKVLYNFKLFKSGIPFYDALYAPFKDKFRFWLGVKMLILFVLYILSRGLDVNLSLFLNTLLLLVLAHIQATIKPYKSYWLNIVDTYFVVTALLLIFGASSFLNSESASLIARVIYGLITIVLPFLIFVAVIIYNLHLQFPIVQKASVKVVQKVTVRKKHHKKQKSHPSFAVVKQPSQQSLVTISQLGFERAAELSVSLLDHDMHYRETLFDE